MKGSLSNLKSIVALFAYVLVSTLVASLLMVLAGKIFPAGLSADNQWSNYIQVAIQTITIFGLPVLLFQSFNKRFEINIYPQKGFLKILVLGFVAWVLCYFPVNALWEINKAVQFPEFMSGIELTLKTIQQQSEQFINEFMMYRGGFHLLMLIVLVGLLPAIFEELFFRGLLQQLISKMFNNIWVPIIITSIVFSVFHFEFYSFLPRVLLGVLLGVAFSATGKLWLPMVLHFINNLSSILFRQLIPEHKFEELANATLGGYQWIVSIVSAILLFYVLKTMLKERSSH